MIVVAPPGYGQYGNNMLEVLGRIPGMFIKQKIELLEVLTGCETKNRYKGYVWDPVRGAEKPSAGKGDEIFKMKEDSGCFERQCCGPARAFTMDISVDSDKIPKMDDDVIVLERPFKCTCLCFNRSVIRVSHKRLGLIGEVYNPFTCCTHELVVRYPKDTAEFKPSDAIAGFPQGDWYVISGFACQPAAFCSLPCGPCAKFESNIYKAEDTAKEHPVGQIARIWSGCIKESVSDADNYVVAFPQDANPIQRACIMSAVMLIDFLYFETKQNNNNNSGSVSASF